MPGVAGTNCPFSRGLSVSRFRSFIRARPAAVGWFFGAWYQPVEVFTGTEGTATDLPGRDSGETAVDDDGGSTAGGGDGCDETAAQTSLTDGWR